MIGKISVITLLVHDQDEALAFYTEKLGFRKLDDQRFGEGFRWLTIAAPGQQELALTLMRVDSDEMLSLVGRQAGHHVLLILDTDDFDADYQALRARDVTFLTEPQEQPWGRMVTFGDLYGNVIELMQRSAGA